MHESCLFCLARWSSSKSCNQIPTKTEQSMQKGENEEKVGYWSELLPPYGINLCTR